jgi:chemotaxis protein CheC
MDPRTLDAVQLDALREFANIGAGHAATALSRITNRRIMVDVPEVRIVPLEGVGEVLGEPERVVCAVVLKVFGDVEGRTLQIFPGETAARLTAMLLRTAEPGSVGTFGLLERSAIKEIGNILVAAYLNALADLMGATLTMSAPGFAIDMAAAILTTSYLNFGVDDDFVMCVNTRLALDDGETLPAHFLLIPDEPSLRGILRILRVS